MSTSRHYENNLQLPPSGGGTSLVPSLAPDTVLRAAAEALKVIKAAALAHRDVSGGGVYVGLAGVALLYLRMAQQLRRGVRYQHGAYLKKHDPDRCLAIAAELLAEADKLTASHRVTFLEGAGGVLACRALLAHMQGQHEQQAACVQELLALWPTRIQGVMPAGECEVLYGRTGYLYAAAWVRAHLGPDSVPRALLRAVVAAILDEGLAGAAAAAAAEGGGGGGPGSSSSSRFGLMWAWHGKRYLGAAHGVAGILYCLLHHAAIVRELDAQHDHQQQQYMQQQQQQAGGGSGGDSGGGDGGGGGGVRSGTRAPAAAAPGRYMAALVRSVDALAAQQLPSGNLPTKLGDTDDTRVAWCHGACGLVLTLLKAAATLGDEGGRYMAAATAAADDIWQRGLLRKGVGLCHGICGNAYALLAVWRVTRAPRYLAAAHAFAGFAAEHWRELYEVPDRPASLFEGLGGAVSLWLDLADPEHSSFPGAELLPDG